MQPEAITPDRNDRPQPTFTTSWELVTPELARQYLESNTANRPVSKPYVRELAGELEEGRFLESHQGIAFDSQGVLMDGQHRLLAIVASGVPAWLLVTRGIDRDAFRVIDQHRRRTAGQLLAMSGLSKDAPRLAAMARAILLTAHNKSRVSNTEATEYAILHSEILVQFLPVARKFTPPIAAAFAWCVEIGWDADEVLEAAKRLIDMTWVGPGDPMRALYRRCEDFKPLGQGAASVKGKFAAALTALQAVRDGRELKQIRKSDPQYAAIERASRAAPARESTIEYDVELPVVEPATAVKKGRSKSKSEPKPEPEVLAAPQTDAEWAAENERRAREAAEGRAALESELNEITLPDKVPNVPGWLKRGSMPTNEP